MSTNTGASLGRHHRRLGLPQPGGLLCPHGHCCTGRLWAQTSTGESQGGSHQWINLAGDVPVSCPRGCSWGFVGQAQCWGWQARSQSQASFATQLHFSGLNQVFLQHPTARQGLGHVAHLYPNSRAVSATKPDFCPSPEHVACSGGTPQPPCMASGDEAGTGRTGED